MAVKTAYIWGPISTFSGSLITTLLQNGWHVHIPTKPALQVSLSPLELQSSAQSLLTRAAGGSDKLSSFGEALKFIDAKEITRSTYDIAIFCGLPANFDEARVARAPWAAAEFPKIIKKLKGVPTLIISSLWSAIQNDNLVPEEIECERRRPKTHFEAVCQQYENKLLGTLNKQEVLWHLVRLPLITGSSINGELLNLSGISSLLQQLQEDAKKDSQAEKKEIALSYNPDSTFWMLPVNVASYLLWRLAEDGARPRICNLVPTEALLNRDWLAHLAQAAGFNSIHSVEKDKLNLPNTLRSMLEDNITVRTRGLFEAMGRYQQSPIIFDSNYFEKLLIFGENENWGSPHRAKTEVMAWSETDSHFFFQHFLPSNLDTYSHKLINETKSGIRFEIYGVGEWQLEPQGNQTKVVSALETANKPAALVRLTKETAARLFSGKVILEQALLGRSCAVSGNGLNVLRTCNFLRHFIRKHPFYPQQTDAVSKEPATSHS